MSTGSNSTVTEPSHKVLIRVIIIGWSSIVVAWGIQLYRYYFDFKVQDAVAMTVAMALAAAANPIIFPGRHQSPLGRWGLGLVVSLQFAAWPLLDWIILRSDHGWAFIYTFLIVMGLLVGFEWRFPRTWAAWGLLTAITWVIPYPRNADQNLYYDKLVATEETRLGEIHVVQWRDDRWVHYNRQLSVTSIDAHMYYEPLVQPAMHLAPLNSNVLLLGGDNGYAIKEIQKHEGAQLTVVPLDREFLQFSVKASDLPVKTQEIFQFLTSSELLFDVIIVDLPDPVNPSLNQYYALEFYEACRERLAPGGYLVTQAGSPYVQTATFKTILKTMESAGLGVLPLHNQVPSLGEWGWALASRGSDTKEIEGKLRAQRPRVSTIWWDQEASALMASFGKQSFFDASLVKINSIERPTLITRKRSRQ